MKGLFAQDSFLYQWLLTLWNWMVVNFCFLLGSLPLITIGASKTAMYSVNLRLAKGDTVDIWHSFWKAYKENFKQATILWLIIVVFAGMMIFNIYLFGSSGVQLFDIYQFMMVILLAILAIIQEFMFAILAKFDNTLKNVFKNAIMMSISNFGKTMLIIFTLVTAIFISFYNQTIFAWAVGFYIALGFGLVTYVLSKYFNAIFEIYIPETTDEEK